jgi:hypothetical protein
MLYSTWWIRQDMQRGAGANFDWLVQTTSFQPCDFLQGPDAFAALIPKPKGCSGSTPRQSQELTQLGIGAYLPNVAVEPVVQQARRGKEGKEQ